MAKNKKSVIPHYELLYIVSNKFTEDELKPIREKVDKLIEANGGKLTYSEDWGKKKFAYPINNYNHGYYSLVEFDLEGANLEKLNKALRMAREVLRHNIVAKEARTPEEIKEEKKKQARQAIEAVARQKEEKEKVEEKKEPVKDKVNLKDLDEKLDKILETDDLL